MQFNGKNWRITDADLETSRVIGYYYVERDLIPRDYEQDVEDLEDSGEMPNANTLYVGKETEVSTENGYIRADDIKIIKRANDKVTLIPLKAGALSIVVLKDGSYETIDCIVKEV